jgi:hypothetical protein
MNAGSGLADTAPTGRPAARISSISSAERCGLRAAVQELADLGGLGIELFAERSDIIAMADELRFQIVDPP